MFTITPVNPESPGSGVRLYSPEPRFPDFFTLLRDQIFQPPLNTFLESTIADINNYMAL